MIVDSATALAVCCFVVITVCLAVYYFLCEEIENNRKIAIEQILSVRMSELEERRAEMIELFSQLANGEPDHAEEQEAMEDRIAEKVAAKLSSNFNKPDESKEDNDGEEAPPVEKEEQ